MIAMFTYIQISDGTSNVFKGYVDYEFKKKEILMTEVRGMKTLRHIKIPFSDVIDLKIENFYGATRISFIYHSQLFSFIDTGYGETRHIVRHFLKAIDSSRLNSSLAI